MAEYLKQKCWSCRYSTNCNLCPWVKKYELPQGARQDGKGYIVECPLYKWDGITETRTDKQIAHDLGISYGTYIDRRIKSEAYFTLLKLLKLHDVETLAKMLGLENCKTILKWKNKKRVPSLKYVKKIKDFKKELIKDYE